MRFVSRMTRQFDQMAGRIGITLAAPYYDDRVVEAGLAVRPEERVTPWRYKPLIVEAMRGIVPAESLARQTKANGSGDEEPGLRRHRAELLALWEDSRLGRLGLIDAERAARAVPRPAAPRSPVRRARPDRGVRGLAALARNRDHGRAVLRSDDAEAAQRGVHRGHRLRHDAAGRGQRRVLEPQPERGPRPADAAGRRHAGPGRAGADRAVRRGRGDRQSGRAGTDRRPALGRPGGGGTGARA